MKTTTAGKSRKSHKSRKTAPTQESVGGPSSVELATTTPPAPNTLETVLLSEDKSKGKDVEVVSPVPSENPKDQWWYRPPDSKARKLAEKIVVMREAGHEDKAIAKRMKTTEGSVRQYVYIARKNGWLNADDEPVDLEAELALNIDRKVVRNIGATLDGQMTNWQTHEMTIAAAKGRGVFKNHDVVKGDGGNMAPIVAIQVIMPPVGEGDQGVVEGSVGGVPAYVEGEINGESGTVGPDTQTLLAAVDSSPVTGTEV